MKDSHSPLLGNSENHTVKTNSASLTHVLFASALAFFLGMFVNERRHNVYASSEQDVGFGDAFFPQSGVGEPEDYVHARAFAPPAKESVNLYMPPQAQPYTNYIEEPQGGLISSFKNGVKSAGGAVVNGVKSAGNAMANGAKAAGNAVVSVKNAVVGPPPPPPKEKLDIQSDDELAKDDPETAKKFIHKEPFPFPETSKKAPPASAKGPIEMVGGCINFIHCCATDKMRQTCGAFLYSIGVETLAANPLKAESVKDVDPVATPSLAGAKYFDLQNTFCQKSVTFNMASVADGFFFVVNRGIKLIGKAMGMLFAAFGPMGEAAKKIVNKIPGIGVLKKALMGTLVNMEKVNIWKSMTTKRIAVVGKTDKDGKIKKGDPIHLYANMNMMIGNKKSFNFVCRMAHAFRFGFITGLFSPAKEMGTAILWFRDIIMGTVDAANYGAKWAKNSTSKAATIMWNKAKNGKSAADVLQNSTAVNMVTQSNLFTKVGTFMKVFVDIASKFLGNLAKPFKWVVTKFYGLWMSIKNDPAVAAALKGIQNADAEALRNSPGAFIDNIVEALANVIFDTPVYTMNKWCLQTASKQPEEEEGKFSKMAGGFMRALDGLFKRSDRRELWEDGAPTAAEILNELSIDDYMSTEDSIALMNKYNEEYVANGNRHPDPEVEEELGAERPDLMWKAAHMYEEAHHELHPEYNWVNPEKEVHAFAAHQYYQKYGGKHTGADPDHFYHHNPHFRR